MKSRNNNVEKSEETILKKYFKCCSPRAERFQFGASPLTPDQGGCSLDAAQACAPDPALAMCSTTLPGVPSVWASYFEILHSYIYLNNKFSIGVLNEPRL